MAKPVLGSIYRSYSSANSTCLPCACGRTILPCGVTGASRSRLANCSLPIYGWFAEGFDTLDLKEAKVLLDQLLA